MTDANKYINAYIDTCIALISDLNIKHIQVQAQLKVASELVKERDETIAAITAELESARNTNTERQKQIDSAKIWEDSYNAMKNKLSHMDTLMAQLGQMKLQLSEKDAEINSLQKQLIEKSTINKRPRKEKQVEEQVSEATPVIETVNDF